MGQDDSDDKLTAKDLLRAGELDAPEHAGERFGRRVRDRHMRRPVGNSSRLWSRVDGEDPFGEPRKKEPPKQRGVYASGRFVRIDSEERRKEQVPRPTSRRGPGRSSVRAPAPAPALLLLPQTIP